MMDMIIDDYWNKLHRERPLWYACVWNACAALASGQEEDAGKNQPPGLQEDDPSSVAIRARSRIFLLIEEQKTAIDTWVLLLLALEDPALAQTSPASFDALRQHMHAAYLLREEFAHRLAGELVRFWEASGGGLVMNGLPPPDPLPDRDALPHHLQGLGSVSLTMGTKRANRAFGAWQALFRQEWGVPPDTSTLLARVMQFLKDALSIKSPAPSQHAAGEAVVLPQGYLRWSQRVEIACHALASRLDQVVEEFGEPPDEDEAMSIVKECADDATYSDCDTCALLLLALEDHGFAECKPDNYEVLQADHHEGEIKLTAEYLIGENVYLALLDELEAYLGGTWLPAYWTARGDYCEICETEAGVCLWAPFAGLPFTFTSLAEQPASTETRLLLRIGGNCMQALECGGTVAFVCDAHPFRANRTLGVSPVGDDHTGGPVLEEE